MTSSSFSTARSSWWRSGIGRLRALLGDPIPAQTLAFFFDQFAVLLNSGITIDAALLRAAPPDDPELQRICAAIERPLQAGVPLHRALLPWKQRLPVIVLPILEVGEVSGTLDNAARRLAAVFGQSAGIERRFSYTIFNPWLVITGLTLYHLIMQGAFGMQMLTEALFTFVRLATLYVVGRLLLCGLWRWQGLRYVFDTIKLALPHMGDIVRKLAAARWGRSFATLWYSGVPISTALEVSSRSALNARYERALCHAAKLTREGRTLADSLATTQLLPPHLLEIVRTGETTGSLAACLEQFVVLLESEAFTKATQEFVFILGVGQIVLIVAAVAAVLR